MVLSGFHGPYRDFEKFLYRYEEATRRLGVNPLTRQIFRTLMFDQGITWNVKRLAERFGRSRPTVREIVDRNVEGGYMLKKRTEIYISDRGLEIFEWVNRETCNIAMGEQAGFTEELIRHFRDLGLPIIDPDVATISFPNDLNLF